MAANQIVTTCEPSIDVYATYGYPATAKVLVLNVGDGTQIHIIWYAGDHSTSFANAPTGSMIVDTTNGTFHIATAKGTWTEIT